MSDTSKREEIIRAVAEAIQEARWAAVRNYDGSVSSKEADSETLARAALAVFEQAYTPTDDERAIAVCIDMASTVYGDYDDAQGALSDIHMMLAPIAAGFRRTAVPSDDEREAARAHADAEYPELPLAPENEDRADIAERAFLAGAGFRRTAVQEPSTVPDGNGHRWMSWSESGKNGTYCRDCGEWAGKVGNRACEVVQGEPTAHDRRRLSPEYVEVGHPSGERQPVEPQGEPTDAQVIAALDAYWGVTNADPYGSRDAMRAALRAAADAGQEEKR